MPQYSVDSKHHSTHSCKTARSKTDDGGHWFDKFLLRNTAGVSSK